MSTKRMVVGFLFRKDNAEVALILKQKPEWQKGKLNGIGGKIEPEESPIQAIRREFKEEAGADVFNWRNFCNLNSSDGSWYVYFFTSSEPAAVTTMESEVVGWYPVSKIPELPVIPNLRWLIPMAIDNVFALAQENMII